MNKLQVGSIIRVNTVLGGDRFYVVFKVEGTKATTHFRVFHTKVHYHQYVYEHGKRQNSNTYTVENSHINDVWGKEDVYKDVETKDGYLFTGYQLETLARINPDKWRYTELAGLVKL